VRQVFERWKTPIEVIAILAAGIFAIAVSPGALALGTGEEFEGRYRVGGTSCTVKPIKMAFEVRWAKGKESMVFFHEWDSRFGNYTYASDEKPSGFDRFVFSDERLVSGVFIRSDGMRYPVNKISSN
jgi:hypothetical protein